MILLDNNILNGTRYLFLMSQSRQSTLTLLTDLILLLFRINRDLAYEFSLSSELKQPSDSCKRRRSPHASPSWPEIDLSRHHPRPGRYLLGPLSRPDIGMRLEMSNIVVLPGSSCTRHNCFTLRLSLTFFFLAAGLTLLGLCMYVCTYSSSKVCSLARGGRILCGRQPLSGWTECHQWTYLSP
ncbi:hypothetical protein F4679DRAFT_110087 [Xylaria curta]|nr:hypothetical protein F4679DRAFT_110087 [Xylaria curta]